MTDTIQKLREALHKAKAALSLALSDVDWRKDSPTQPVIHKAYNCAHQALALPTAAPVVERDALDAARYRWLADCNNYPEAVTLISDGSLTADALGKAIDAAMRKDKP